MKPRPLALTALSVALLLLTSCSTKAVESGPPRLVLAEDAGWKFLLGDPRGAEALAFPDSAWRKGRLAWEMRL